MIPNEYWQLARRWAWLIAACFFGGILVAVTMLPPLVGSGSAFDASSTLGVSNNVTLTNIATRTTIGTEGAATGDDEVAADYAPVIPSLRPVDARTLAEYADTPQFVSSLRKKLEGEKVFLADADIRELLEVKATPSLFRLDLSARTGSERTATAVVTKGAEVLSERAKAEELGITNDLIASLQEGENALTERLTALQTTRDELFNAAMAKPEVSVLGRPETQQLAGNLSLALSGGSPGLDQQIKDIVSALAKVVGDPQLTLVDTEIRSVEAQLGELVTEQERLSVNAADSQPVAIVIPTETVEIEGDPVSTRDMALLGAVAGLVMAWVSVNLAERMRPNFGVRVTDKNRARLH
jgi:hypothetical protein